MRKAIDWIKTHKLTTILGIIVLYFLFRNSYPISLIRYKLATRQFQGEGVSNLSYPAMEGLGGAELQTMGVPSILPPPQPDAIAPTTDVAERLVVRETNLSLLVKEVRSVADEIVNFVEAQGGYMVSTSLTQPEEAPYATIVVRIPTEKLRDATAYFRSLAVKVTSEYVSGYDVTDQYEDIEARVATLEKTKQKFESILDQAVKIDDILRVQREIINLQAQIDSLKGRQKYLEQTAKLARITVSISTDELALPYAPSDTFRPAVIFKLAVRSLILNLRKIAGALIWIAVYSVIWLPVLAVVFVIKRWRKRIPREKQA